MKGLKKQLKSRVNNLLKICKAKSQLAMEVAAICLALAGVGILAVKAPEMHSAWLRSKVGSKVYTISGEHGLGTGFAIKAPSGQTYILTNDHVCGVSKDGVNLKVTDSVGHSLNRKIIERSQYSDLCLIEGMPGVEGLSLGTAPSIGQIIAAIGHPAGYGLTMSRGEVIQKQDVMIEVGPMEYQNPENGEWIKIKPEEGGITPEQCALPKNAQPTFKFETWFGPINVKLCVVVTKNAYYTNMNIQPGSSGSPVVNFWGNVVGVVFAGDQAMWGIAVNKADVIDFLHMY